MNGYILNHLSDELLLRDLTSLVSRDRATTAALLAHLAEVDARRLYVPAGHASMFAYCVDELRFSEEAAARRIQAARAARRFPALFRSLEEGTLHMTAVCLLAPHLTPDNFDELIEAAAGRRKSEIEEYLVRRFPFRAPKANDVATIRPIAPHTTRPGAGEPVRPGAGVPVQPGAGEPTERSIFDQPADGGEHSPAIVAPTSPTEHSPANVAPTSSTEHSPANVAPTSPTEHSLANVENHPSSPQPADSGGNASLRSQQTAEPRYLVRLTIRRSTHDKLREAQALLSHAVPAGDVAEVLDRALDALIAQLHKRRLGTGSSRAKSRAHSAQHSAPNHSARKHPAPVRSAPKHPARQHPARKRYIPAQVRREVWERDHGQCTFVNADGRRCVERRFLELDHIDPVARGGRGTTENIRLRCRAHNQYEAERAFGAGFMDRKRSMARRSPPGSRGMDVRPEATR